MLLDTYGHFMPSESRGFADALSVVRDGSGRHYAAPDSGGFDGSSRESAEAFDTPPLPSILVVADGCHSVPL